jgi:hypothetical protein
MRAPGVLFLLHPSAFLGLSCSQHFHAAVAASSSSADGFSDAEAARALETAVSFSIL